MPRARRAGELLLAAVLSLLVVITATGWLYLVRGPLLMSGPSVRDALPLDELPARSGVPLLPFLAVWALCGVVLGLIASAARVERLTAALLFAAGAAAFLLPAAGLSIFVVRQIPAGESFEAGLRVPAAYVAAALAGLGGALLGTASRRGSRRAPVILALLVAACGLLDVVSAVTPEIASRLRMIEDTVPNFLPKLASALVVPAGLALIVLARGLSHRRRRAWQITLVLMLVASALHLLKGLDYEEAAVSMTLALALVARRHDFEGRGDPTAHVRLLRLAVVFLGAVLAYGAAALWVNRISADQPYTAGFVLRETGAALIGMHLRGSAHVGGHFGEWFPLSVFLLGVAGLLTLLWLWLAPWRYRLSQHAGERERAHGLVASYGTDTLAPFALRADKSYFFGAGERAFLAYKVTTGVAVISGDPIGPPEEVLPMVERFLAFAHQRGWRVAVLGAGERYLPLYRRLGLRSLYHGDEAVVETAGFSLEGRAIRKVRQSVARLEREGYRAELLYAGDIGEEIRAELEDVARSWRGDAPEKGFTMELDTLFRLEGRDAVFAIGYDADEVVAGFIHFAVVWPGRALSLSSMPRKHDSPNGFNEWMVVETIQWAAAHGFEHVSLNFAPFATVFAPEVDGTSDGGRRLQRRALRALKGHGFQLENLLQFNRKFFPRWEQRFVVYERPLDLPRVGVAGLAAEGYLPLPGARR